MAADVFDKSDADLHAELDRDAPTPLHDQVAAAIRRRIGSGRWPAHMQLPGEPDLAQLLQVARGTVRRATRTLIGEGLLIQHQGRGTFVGSPMLEQSFAQEIITSAEALDRDGVRYVTTVVRQGLAIPPENIAGHLHLSATDEQVVSLRRVRSVDSAPVFVLDNYIVAKRCPGLENADFASRPLFNVIEEDYGLVIDGMQRTFQAQLATPAVAELLKVAPGSAVLYLEQIAYTKGTAPIEYSDVWIRGDKLRLSAWLQR